MVKILKPGNSIRNFRCERLLNKGNMAIAYAALTPLKERVFLKQYKSPTPQVGWFNDYVNYQQEMKTRIEANRIDNYCIRIKEFFVEKWGSPCYWQVFEFVEAGHDLETALAEMRAKPAKYPFTTRLTLAKVFASALQALHQANLIHSDLKPPNVQLFEDKTIRTGYQLKLIDMDFSVLSDRKAPWEAERGYIGSPHYFSPEHLAGVAPTKGSDIFSAALILYQLLGDKHPYQLDDEEYTAAINSHRAAPPKLDGDSGYNEAISRILHRCLDPNHVRRPTAVELSEVLQGGGAKAIETPTAVADTKPTTPVVIEPKKPVEPKKDVAKQRSITLRNLSGGQIDMRVRTAVGKQLLRAFGDDNRFWDEEQFVLIPQPDGSWTVQPNTNAGNETMLNGRAITTPTQLKSGDILAVGREAKRVIKLPLTVQLNEIADDLEV